MKKIILLTVLFAVSLAYAQNQIDPTSMINSITPSTIFNYNNHYIKAWNWSSESNKLDNALLMDFNQTNRIPKTQNPLSYLYRQGQSWIFTVNPVVAGDCFPATTQAQAMHYELTLLINQPGIFQTREDDNTNPIFGFKYINPNIANMF